LLHQNQTSNFKTKKLWQTQLTGSNCPPTILNGQKIFMAKYLTLSCKKWICRVLKWDFSPATNKVWVVVLLTGDGNKPNAEGTLVYLNGGDDLNIPLNRVETAGGKVLMPKTSIGENGNMAIFMDTEGNRVAFHSMG
jgi:hypothetical protein